jgi:hypothetical protein
LGAVSEAPQLEIRDSDRDVLTASLSELKEAWLAPLDWE